MKLAHLLPEVLDDLRQGDRWRLDIDPGFDSKHEFWMDWGHFLVADHYTQSAEQLADFLIFDGFDVLLPVPRSHHPHIRLVRLIPSADGKSLTLFLHDAFHRQWFQNTWAARHGFLAVADRYQNHGCDFFLANYYHFVYLVHEDFETAKHIMLT
jgi:hypothetical protein